jgi:hypothetical protein
MATATHYFDLENGGNKQIRKVGSYRSEYIASYPIKPQVKEIIIEINA